jgi:hypothetical protein
MIKFQCLKLSNFDNIVEVKVSIDGDELFHDRVNLSSG